MRYLIGFGLIILGGVLGAVTGFMPFIILMLVGVFLFASFPSQAEFSDYVIVNSRDVLMRKRHYINFFPFLFVSYILTLGKASLQIPWKEEYYIATIGQEDNVEKRPITRAQYLSIRNHQRKVYSTQVLSREFMASAYCVERIGLKRKKTRLILAVVFAVIALLMVAAPGGIYLALIYEAVFLPMVFLWIPNYQDAKIMQEAYDRAMNAAPRTF